MLINRTIEFLLYPPANLILFLLLGFLLALWRKRLGQLVIMLGVVQLLLLSTPVVSEYLFLKLRLQNLAKPELWKHQSPDAIVVLGSSRNSRAREFVGMETSSGIGIERLRYAALLHRKTSLPILITGGVPSSESGVQSEAQLMAKILFDEFGIKAKWLEEESHTTWENAHYTDRLLSKAGVKSAWLVTQEWHMPRALMAFSGRQVEYLPASTSFSLSMSWSSHWFKYIPQASALYRSNIYLHEWLGLFWYRIKHAKA